VSSSSDELEHFLPAFNRMLLALETGQNGEASRAADDFLRRRPAWEADQLSTEPSIYAYGVKLLAGRMSRADFGKVRADWVALAKVQRDRTGAGTTAASDWSAASAFPAITAADAQEALASLPAIRPLVDPYEASPYLGEPIGRAYLLAGKLDDAVAELSRASSPCAVFDSWGAVLATWATFDLGQALEARGDVSGACAAYARVVARWGTAKPGSRTADKAHAHAGVLGCPR
jgi:hypothetical protein